MSLVWFALACSTKSAPVERPADLEADVRGLLDRYLQAFADRDTDAIRTLYVDDGRLRWVERGRVQYRSADEVAQSLAQLPPMPLVTTLSDIEVLPVGSGAAMTTAAFRTQMGQGDDAFTFSGTLTFFVEQGVDGWRIVGGTTSTPSPE